MNQSLPMIWKHFKKKYSGTLIGDYISYFLEKDRNAVEEKALYYAFRLYWKQAGDRQNMIIRQLNIKNSGEIHDKTLEFSPGINVLYGENESKSDSTYVY